MYGPFHEYMYDLWNLTELIFVFNGSEIPGLRSCGGTFLTSVNDYFSVCTCDESLDSKLTVNYNFKKNVIPGDICTIHQII